MSTHIVRGFGVGLAALAVILLAHGVATAAKPISTINPPLAVGNDISWPQCGKKLPSGQSFGVVGVNGGTASTSNPCFPAELAWATSSSGGTAQAKAALYVNTANPGHAGTWWPASNFYGGIAVTNPYGICTGNVDAACAYMYGYAKAYDDVSMRGVTNPSSYLWWFDVETSNTWQADKTANMADLEGMYAYFHSIGASAGLYSTSYQLEQITGTVPPTNPLFGLRSWLAGAGSQASAKTMCSDPPLVSGAPVFLTQYVLKDLDYDYSCF